MLLLRPKQRSWKGILRLYNSLYLARRLARRKPLAISRLRCLTMTMRFLQTCKYCSDLHVIGTEPEEHEPKGHGLLRLCSRSRCTRRTVCATAAKIDLLGYSMSTGSTPEHQSTSYLSTVVVCDLQKSSHSWPACGVLQGSLLHGS